MRDRQGVISAGRLYCDLLFTGVPRLPSFGTEVFAEGLEMRAGGGAYITAAHLASLGRPAALAAFFPGDPFGGLVRTEVEAAMVDTGLCGTAAGGLDPQITVAVVGASDRAFLTRRAGPAVPDLSLADLQGRAASHLHISELGTLIEHPGLIALAREAGLTLSLDCGWDDAIDGAVAAPLIAQVDVFLPNRDEASWLADLGVPAPFAPLTVIKCGAEGAEAHQDGQRQVARAEPVKAVDTTGAGDAFNAGFLNAWLQGKDVMTALQAGNACGARAVRMVGGFNADPGQRAAS